MNSNLKNLNNEYLDEVRETISYNKDNLPILLNEPIFSEFYYLGYHCVILRSRFMYYLGYVGVPKGSMIHKLLGDDPSLIYDFPTEITYSGDLDTIFNTTNNLQYYGIDTSTIFNSITSLVKIKIGPVYSHFYHPPGLYSTVKSKYISFTNMVGIVKDLARDIEKYKRSKEENIPSQKALNP